MESTPTNVEAMSDIPVTVEVQDGFGNVIIGAVNEVTLRFATNPGEALLHSSGNGPAVFETMDPTTLVGTGFLESIHNREMRGILHNAADGLTYAISRAHRIEACRLVGMTGPYLRSRKMQSPLRVIQLYSAVIANSSNFVE